MDNKKLVCYGCHSCPNFTEDLGNRLICSECGCTSNFHQNSPFEMVVDDDGGEGESGDVVMHDHFDQDFTCYENNMTTCNQYYPDRHQSCKGATGLKRTRARTKPVEASRENEVINSTSSASNSTSSSGRYDEATWRSVTFKLQSRRSSSSSAGCKRHRSCSPQMACKKEESQENNVASVRLRKSSRMKFASKVVAKVLNCPSSKHEKKPRKNKDDSKCSLQLLAKPMSQRMTILVDSLPAPYDVQLQHAWNPDDCSFNIFVKDDDQLTFHRHPIAQSTDCIRGRTFYETGIHLFEINWPVKQRGTHAAVGVCTPEAPLQTTGYQILVGSNEHSWGWDLVRGRANHDSKNNDSLSYPNTKGKFEVPEKFLMMLNMDEGVLGFIVDGVYLGPAFSGLKSRKLHVIVSAVWGHCQVTMKYLGGLECQPLHLSDLCRHIIRQSITKKGMTEGKIDQLNLPKPIKNFLMNNDHLY